MSNAITREALEFIAKEKPCRKDKEHAWQPTTLMQMVRIDVDGKQTVDLVSENCLRCVYCRFNLLWADLQISALEVAMEPPRDEQRS
jgi:hypothetical protein